MLPPAYTAPMSRRPSDPLLLDVEKVAEQGQLLQGSRPLCCFARLVEMAHSEAAPGASDAVNWRVRGERCTKRGGAAQTWLCLEAHTQIALTCQRCLQPLAQAVEVRRSFRFVADEEAAARLDAETDDDVLATSRSLDLLALVEDELLLALPLVPRHADCRMPIASAAFSGGLEPGSIGGMAGDADPNPFAVLAALKGRGGSAA